jgi:WD40 repeat protein
MRELPSGRTLYRRTVRAGPGALAFSPDGRLLAATGCCAGGSSVTAWAARTGARLYQRRADASATMLAVSSDSRRLAVGFEDGAVELWDARRGTRIGAPLPAAVGAIASLSFSPDERLLAVSSADQTATLWDLAARERVGRPFLIEGVVPVVVFASTGRLLIDELGGASEWPTDVRTQVRFACQVAGRGLTAAEWRDLLPNRPYRRVCGG